MTRSEKIWQWLAWRMPRDLVYWCTIRAISNATMGAYGTTDVHTINPMHVLERWMFSPEEIMQRDSAYLTEFADKELLQSYLLEDTHDQ